MRIQMKKLFTKYEYAQNIDFERFTEYKDLNG